MPHRKQSNNLWTRGMMLDAYLRRQEAEDQQLRSGIDDAVDQMNFGPDVDSPQFIAPNDPSIAPTGKIIGPADLGHTSDGDPISQTDIDDISKKYQQRRAETASPLDFMVPGLALLKNSIAGGSHVPTEMASPPANTATEAAVAERNSKIPKDSVGTPAVLWDTKDRLNPEVAAEMKEANVPIQMPTPPAAPDITRHANPAPPMVSPLFGQQNIAPAPMGSIGSIGAGSMERPMGMKPLPAPGNNAIENSGTNIQGDEAKMAQAFAKVSMGLIGAATLASLVGSQAIPAAPELKLPKSKTKPKRTPRASIYKPEEDSIEDVMNKAKRANFSSMGDPTHRGSTPKTTQQSKPAAPGIAGSAPNTPGLEAQSPIHISPRMPHSGIEPHSAPIGTSAMKLAGLPLGAALNAGERALAPLARRATTAAKPIIETAEREAPAIGRAINRGMGMAGDAVNAARGMINRAMPTVVRTGEAAPTVARTGKAAPTVVRGGGRAFPAAKTMLAPPGSAGKPPVPPLPSRSPTSPPPLPQAANAVAQPAEAAVEHLPWWRGGNNLVNTIAGAGGGALGFFGAQKGWEAAFPDKAQQAMQQLGELQQREAIGHTRDQHALGVMGIPKHPYFNHIQEHFKSQGMDPSAAADAAQRTIHGLSTEIEGSPHYGWLDNSKQLTPDNLQNYYKHIKEAPGYGSRYNAWLAANNARQEELAKHLGTGAPPPQTGAGASPPPLPPPTGGGGAPTIWDRIGNNDAMHNAMLAGGLGLGGLGLYSMLNPERDEKGRSKNNTMGMLAGLGGLGLGAYGLSGGDMSKLVNPNFWKFSQAKAAAGPVLPLQPGISKGRGPSPGSLDALNVGPQNGPNFTTGIRAKPALPAHAQAGVGRSGGQGAASAGTGVSGPPMTTSGKPMTSAPAQSANPIQAGMDWFNRQTGGMSNIPKLMSGDRNAVLNTEMGRNAAINQVRQQMGSMQQPESGVLPAMNRWWGNADWGQRAAALGGLGLLGMGAYSMYNNATRRRKDDEEGGASDYLLPLLMGAGGAALGSYGLTGSFNPMSGKLFSPSRWIGQPGNKIGEPLTMAGPGGQRVPLTVPNASGSQVAIGGAPPQHVANNPALSKIYYNHTADVIAHAAPLSTVLRDAQAGGVPGQQRMVQTIATLGQLPPDAQQRYFLRQIQAGPEGMAVVGALGSPGGQAIQQKIGQMAIQLGLPPESTQQLLQSAQSAWAIAGKSNYNGQAIGTMLDPQAPAAPPLVGPPVSKANPPTTVAGKGGATPPNGGVTFPGTPRS